MIAFTPNNTHIPNPECFVLARGRLKILKGSIRTETSAGVDWDPERSLSVTQNFQQQYLLLHLDLCIFVYFHVAHLLDTDPLDCVLNLNVFIFPECLSPQWDDVSHLLRIPHSHFAYNSFIVCTLK